MTNTGRTARAKEHGDNPLNVLATALGDNDCSGSTRSLIINGDALQVLRSVQATDVLDTAVTSPPYFGLRTPLVGGEVGHEPTIQEYVARLVMVFDEVLRLLKEAGSLWVNIGDRSIKGAEQQIPSQFALAMMQRGWILRQTIIWNKSQCGGNAIRCFQPVFEYVYWFVKSNKYHWNKLTTYPKGDPVANAIRIAQGTMSQRFQRQRNPKKFLSAMSRKLYGNVWTILHVSDGVGHDASYPVQLPLRAIEATCPPEGIVLDPFAGRGTTGEAALETGRRFVGIEINPSFAELAQRNLALEIASGKG